MNIFRSKKFRYGSVSVALVAVIIAAVILVNAIFTALSEKYLWYIDLTTHTRKKTKTDSLGNKYYEYEDYAKGKEYIHDAAEQGYEPASEAIKAIERGLNAQIVIGVCDLFYYASNIIEERAEDMYSKEHQVNYHGIDKRQRSEIRAKKNAQGHRMRGM